MEAGPTLARCAAACCADTCRPIAALAAAAATGGAGTAPAATVATGASSSESHGGLWWLGRWEPRGPYQPQRSQTQAWCRIVSLLRPVPTHVPHAATWPPLVGRPLRRGRRAQSRRISGANLVESPTPSRAECGVNGRAECGRRTDARARSWGSATWLTRPSVSCGVTDAVQPMPCNRCGVNRRGVNRRGVN